LGIDDANLAGSKTIASAAVKIFAVFDIEYNQGLLDGNAPKHIGEAY
jgi:hypothetical protein